MAVLLAVLEPDPSRETGRGLAHAAALVEMTAFGAVPAASIPGLLEKARGAEWGLSVPSSKTAVRVKSVDWAVKETVQSMALAIGFIS